MGTRHALIIGASILFGFAVLGLILTTHPTTGRYQGFSMPDGGWCVLDTETGQALHVGDVYPLPQAGSWDRCLVPVDRLK